MYFHVFSTLFFAIWQRGKPGWHFFWSCSGETSVYFSEPRSFRAEISFDKRRPRRFSKSKSENWIRSFVDLGISIDIYDTNPNFMHFYVPEFPQNCHIFIASSLIPPNYIGNFVIRAVDMGKCNLGQISLLFTPDVHVFGSHFVLA